MYTPPTHKCCSRCRESRPVAQFSKCSRTNDGFQNYCKPCVAFLYQERYRPGTPYRRAALHRMMT